MNNQNALPTDEKDLTAYLADAVRTISERIGKKCQLPARDANTMAVMVVTDQLLWKFDQSTVTQIMRDCVNLMEQQHKENK